MKEDFSFGVIPLKKEEGEVKVLLIVHKGGKHWGFPKGRKDGEETDLETARRELKEETGLTLKECLSYIPYVESYKFYRAKDKISKTVTYFPCLVEGELCLQEEEVIAAHWMPLNQARLHLTFRETREICKKVEAFLVTQPI